jgi:patatin-related protein
MAFEKPSKDVTELTQEFRFATTMTGGVSLAIWMAGVAREINLLAQASQWRRVGGELPSNNTTLAGAPEASLKLYTALIELLDVVVDVDILSGTSAGGINAALLAWSRVRGSDLGRLREIWLDLGSLTELIRNPKDKTTPSLLYGDEHMFYQLAKQIPDLPDGPFAPEDVSQAAHEVPTTLFVTTTLLDGETSRFTDAYGTLVQDVDRRGIFTFHENELAEEDTANALALAARSTASFPLAFEPSFIPFNERVPQKGRVPARPPMERFANITRPHWVADGGLLDNQPIDVLLQSIFDRPAQKPVRRVLLFVVPSAGPAPDLIRPAPLENVNEPLGLVEGLQKELAAVTTQSIAADLRAIRAHQDRMEARTGAKLRLAEFAVRLEDERLLTSSLFEDYRSREATKHAEALASALLRQLSTWPPASSGAVESIPLQWESELAIGGDGEGICRRQIRESILNRWSPELPLGPVQFAGYGRPAHDLAKGCALAVVQAAYQVAQGTYRLEDSASTNIRKCQEIMVALAQLTANVHGNSESLGRPDLGALVRTVCASREVRAGSLEDAAKTLAEEYVDNSPASEAEWEGLGDAVADSLEMLGDLVAEASSALRLEDRVAANQLRIYLDYLGRQDDSTKVAKKLFDLAVTQRAMLPADADIEQSVELVQVSADTRSLLAPDWQTAQQKLTAMQFHHFGAFYKRSWRANDWMWGRLDGAGWLVHILLDPRRVRWIVQTREEQDESGTQWFLDKLKDIGAPDFPERGFPLPGADGQPTKYLTKTDLIAELGFLDNPSAPAPSSIPRTALWLAHAWQRLILDEELVGLANAVLDPEQGDRPDWSPAKSRRWAEEVRISTQDAEGTKRNAEEATKKAAAAARMYGSLLNRNPVASETFATDKSSPLMALTITKAAATASATVGSVRQLPGALKPPLTTVRTLALGGYRVVSSTKGGAKTTITIGAILLVLGAAFAFLSPTMAGAWGLLFTGIGGYAVVLATWQLSRRGLFAALSFTVVLATFALTTECVRKYLFGNKDQNGVISRHIYWFGTQWWYPLIPIAVVALIVGLLSATNPRGNSRVAQLRRRS